MQNRTFGPYLAATDRILISFHSHVLHGHERQRRALHVAAERPVENERGRTNAVGGSVADNVCRELPRGAHVRSKASPLPQLRNVQKSVWEDKADDDLAMHAHRTHQ
jgi:hypothetical protein